MREVGFVKRLWSEALPFVARSPEMKVAWLVEVLKKKSLIYEEITPYMHLLLSEYENYIESPEYEEKPDILKVIFQKLDRAILSEMICCTGIYDLPGLLSLIDNLNVEEATLALQKEPPVYEKKPLFIIDKVFQAVNECSDGLLERAAKKMINDGSAPDQFSSSYERFKGILHDENILSTLYPHAKR